MTRCPACNNPHTWQTAGTPWFGCQVCGTEVPADRRKIGTYRDLDAFQIIEDRRVMVRLDQPGHRLAEEYVPASQLAGAVEALEKIKAEEGKVCDRFELCEHRACNSSYAAWAIADQALRAVREQ